jgi:molybdenum cofactor synthesis domain-containing protein
MRAMRPGAAFDADLLLAPDVAIAAYLTAVKPVPLGIERVALADAFARILARDAVAAGPYPADDRSTMDGFAVRSQDGAATRRIAGAIRMGAAPPAVLGADEALRIPTGGVLPAGADAVIPLEDVLESGDTIAPQAPIAAGDYFTRRGEDMQPGDRVLRAGVRIGAAELAVLATLGSASVEVFRRPLVAIVPTGDELVDVAQTPATGQVRDSNRWALAGGLAAIGCDVLQLPSAEDTVDAIAARLAEALAVADAVLLSGGSSVGARDHVPAAIDRFGTPGIVVHGLKVKPGKPTVLAAIGSKPVIGLPGNPASALTMFLAIAVPLLRALTGECAPRPATVDARAAQRFTGRAGWTWYVPSSLAPDGVRPLQLRSAHTSLLARADGYVVVGPERTVIEAGEPVTLVRYGGRS